jgi:hypothetical protein
MQQLIEENHTTTSHNWMSWLMAKLKYAVFLAESPFNRVIGKTNAPASQNEMAWMELLDCLVAVAEDPSNEKTLIRLEQKAKEVSEAATLREMREVAEILSKAVLFGSFYLTTACAFVISIAIVGFGATIASPIVASAVATMMISKSIFMAGAALTLLKMAWALMIWALKSIAACIAKCFCCANSKNEDLSGSDSKQEKENPASPQKNLQSQAIERNQNSEAPVKIAVDSLSPLKKFSFLAKEICTLARVIPQSGCGKKVML